MNNNTLCAVRRRAGIKWGRCKKLECRVTAVLVAAGSSTRMGFDKLGFDLGGETVLERSVRAFDECPEVDELVIVTGASSENAQRAAACCKKPVRLVRGGSTRAESARSGVAAAHGRLVAVHDAARPFVSQSVIADTIAAAARCGAAAPAVPVKDTIKRAKGGDGKTVPEGCMVENTPDRSTLYAVQTPQCFDRAAYLAALDELDEASARLVTDDCSLFELTGRSVELVQGDYANIKITTREDLPRAGNGGKKMRIGHGYDVHRLVEGRKLILGGVEVPYEKGLLGHSDADVLAHAVMDAVLGAAALGDIGQHFPDTAEEYAGADSLMLARRVAEIMTEHGWRIENIDATILYATGGTEVDLNADTPYNTRTHKGLTPTAIASPGVDALKAAVYPDSTRYYFYALGDDGKHHFFATYREQQNFIASQERYQNG